jgi:hypothetical protein
MNTIKQQIKNYLAQDQEINLVDKTYTLQAVHGHLSIWNAKTITGLKYKRSFIEVSFLELAKQMLANDGNARPATATGPNHKRMQTGILFPERVNQTRGLFTIRNNGIVVIADSIKQRGSNILEINFGQCGTIADGGNTQLVIKRVIEDLLSEDALSRYSDDQIQQILSGEFIMLEVISDIDPNFEIEISEITEARAATLAQKATSIVNQRGDYDWIKEILGEKEAYISWAADDYLNDLEDVALTEKDIKKAKKNRKRNIQATLLLQILAAGSSYVNAKDSYNKGDKIALDLSNRPEAYKSMQLVAMDFFKIHNYLIANAGRWYKYKTGKAANTEEEASIFYPIKPSDKAEELEQLPFLTDEGKAIFNKSTKTLVGGFAFPILASLRNLLVEKEINIDGKITKQFVWVDGVDYNAIISWLENGLGCEIISSFVISSKGFGWKKNPTINNGNCWSEADRLMLKVYSKEKDTEKSFEQSIMNDPAKLKIAMKVIKQMETN